MVPNVLLHFKEARHALVHAAVQRLGIGDLPALGVS